MPRLALAAVLLFSGRTSEGEKHVKVKCKPRPEWVSGHSLRSSRTPASPSPADIRYDNQAVPVGPKLPTQIVPGQDSRMVAAQRKAPELPAMSAAQRGNGVPAGGHGAFGMTAVVKRIRGHAVDIGGREITFPDRGGLAPGDAFELALATWVRLEF